MVMERWRPDRAARKANKVRSRIVHYAAIAPDHVPVCIVSPFVDCGAIDCRRIAWIAAQSRRQFRRVVEPAIEKNGVAGRGARRTPAGIAGNLTSHPAPDRVIDRVLYPCGMESLWIEKRKGRPYAIGEFTQSAVLRSEDG